MALKSYYANWIHSTSIFRLTILSALRFFSSICPERFMHMQYTHICTLLYILYISNVNLHFVFEGETIYCHLWLELYSTYMTLVALVMAYSSKTILNLYAHLFAKADNFMRNFKIITDTDRETHIRKYINISDVEKCDLMNTKSECIFVTHRCCGWTCLQWQCLCCRLRCLLHKTNVNHQEHKSDAIAIDLSLCEMESQRKWNPLLIY